MPRRKWFILVAFVVFFGVDLIILFWWFNRPTTTEPPPAIGVSSDHLQHTVIVPTLDTPIPAGKNAVWCATFQMAWQQFQDDVTLAPIRISNADEICRRLNESKVAEADLVPASYYAAAGTLQDGTVELIQRKMAKKFPQAEKPAFPGAEGAVAFAYLNAALQYEFEFTDNPLPFEFQAGNQSHKVKSFGILRSQDGEGKDTFRGQVAVLFDSWGGREVREKPTTPRILGIDLSRRSQPYQIVVAMLPRTGSLGEMLADLNARSGKERVGGLDMYDALTVPNLACNVNHAFPELEGPDKTLLNDEFRGLPVAARQMIDFRLDRQGARVTSEAKFYPKSGPGPGPYNFNRPFLIVLKKRDAANPFFVMWVDNAELLQQWGQ